MVVSKKYIEEIMQQTGEIIRTPFDLWVSAVINEAYQRGICDGRAQITKTGHVQNTDIAYPISKHLTPIGYVLVPDEENMTDELAEVIAKKCNCCGGIAYEVYCAILAQARKEIENEE